jgi:hypothetical protein
MSQPATSEEIDAARQRLTELRARKTQLDERMAALCQANPGMMAQEELQLKARLAQLKLETAEAEVDAEAKRADASKTEQDRKNKETTTVLIGLWIVATIYHYFYGGIAGYVAALLAVLIVVR